MRVLCFGDIYARPGRRAVRAALPPLKQKFDPDFIIGNVENLAGGRGVTQKTLLELKDAGFDAFTSGNHIWDNREVYDAFRDKTVELIRPANYPNPAQDPALGLGITYLEKNGFTLCLINLMGRVFMESIDCPFLTVDTLLSKIPEHTAVVVDIHAETTSEKTALAWHLAGRVSAVYGTHTHVQTSDERILPGGTAYLTDVGMSGAYNSCIGMEPKGVIQGFVTRRKVPKKNADGDLGVGCVIFDIDDNGRATSVNRFRFSVDAIERGELPWSQ